MLNQDWRSIIGQIIIALVLIALAVIIYFVVSGQWGSKRFRGIEKFRGDRIEQVDPQVPYASTLLEDFSRVIRIA